MRKKLVIAVLVSAGTLASLVSWAHPADAMKLKPIIGCDSLLQWPCPGPVLVNP